MVWVHTLEDELYSTNTVSNQINVTGWKNVYSDNGISVHYNGQIIQLNCGRTFSSIAKGTSNVLTLPNNLSAQSITYIRTNVEDVDAYLTSSGTFNLNNRGSSSLSNKQILCGVTFMQKQSG